MYHQRRATDPYGDSEISIAPRAIGDHPRRRATDRPRLAAVRQARHAQH